MRVCIGMQDRRRKHSGLKPGTLEKRVGQGRVGLALPIQAGKPPACLHVWPLHAFEVSRVLSLFLAFCTHSACVAIDAVIAGAWNASLHGRLGRGNSGDHEPGRHSDDDCVPKQPGPRRPKNPLKNMPAAAGGATSIGAVQQWVLQLALSRASARGIPADNTPRQRGHEHTFFLFNFTLNIAHI